MLFKNLIIEIIIKEKKKLKLFFIIKTILTVLYSYWLSLLT